MFTGMDGKKLQQLLKRYKDGQCSSEEIAELELWLDSLSQGGEWSWTADEQLYHQISLKEKIDNYIKETNRLPLLWIKVAAILFLFVSTGILFRHTNRDSKTPVLYQNAFAAMGQIKKIMLPDGSTVYLNGGSSIRFPVKFNTKKREIFMETGEAYFDVIHKDNQPFIVYAGKTKTQVLGTAFNVRFYSFLKNTEITVARGKVVVKGPAAKAVFLLPNDQASFNKKNEKLSLKKIAYADATGWLNGKIRFNNETLENAAGMIEVTYAAKITFPDPAIKSIRLTGSFDRTDQLKDILFAICKANKLQYSLHNKTVIIKP